MHAISSINPKENELHKQFSNDKIHLTDDLYMNSDFYNLTPAGYFILDEDGLILNVNSRGSKLLGQKKSDLIKKELSTFVTPVFNPQYQNMLKNKIITKLNRKEIKLINNMKEFWAELVVLYDSVNKIFKVSIIDINEYKEVERALMENERKFRISLETLLDAFAIFSAVRINNKIVDFKIEYIKEVGCRLNQKTYGKQVGYNILNVFPELKSSEMLEEYIKVVETGESLVKESLIYKKVRGEKKLSKAYDIRVVKLGDGLAITWRDVTESKKSEIILKKSLKEKEILLKEIHHRIKNNMQIISSLLGLQSMYVKEKDGISILKESQDRVKSMALVHEKLYGSYDFTKINIKEYIKDLSLHLFNSFDASYIKLEINGEDLFLDLDTAIPYGLIINELITNSIKYAFPLKPDYNSNNEYLNQSKCIFENNECKTNDECRIKIELFSDEKQITLKVTDNGIGISEDRNLENDGTLGFLIIKTLVNQIGGKINVFKNNGTTFEITFPISQAID